MADRRRRLPRTPPPRDGGAPRCAAERGVDPAPGRGGDDADLRRAGLSAVHLPPPRTRGVRHGRHADGHLTSIVGVLTASDVMAARERIAGLVHRTPTLRSTSLGELLGGIELHLKAELFQRTGSFKPRGVANKLLSLSDEEKERGFVTISRGNHAQALAYAATAIGTQATIVMAADA